MIPLPIPSVLFMSAVLVCLAGLGNARVAEPAGFAVPEGFTVSRFSSNELAQNITAMTLDAQGRVVVAGPGYIKTLHDDNGDGIADRAVLFSKVPASGAHGLCFDGNDLLASGDRSILRLRDANGDGVADGAPEVVRPQQNQGEHGTHAIKRGPDGWFHVMIGNGVASGAYAGLSAESPIRDPQQGALVRFSPDFRRAEAVAHGFRNAYDFDFSGSGHLFTVDSDGERVHHLPGYAPTRLYDLAIGAHHGWGLRNSSHSGIRQPYFLDTVERIVEFGRGSPTGVLAYRHRQFPERYRQGVFSACWSLGTITFVPLRERDSTFDGAIEVFMKPVGNDGFAPVALAVNPDGDLLVAIGGRRTRGSVFRVRYAAAPASTPPGSDDLTAVLAADQALSTWSRARWRPTAQRLGAGAFARAAGDTDLPLAQRLRAIEVLVDIFNAIPSEASRRLAEDREPALVARLAWALGRLGPDLERHALLRALVRHPSVTVQRTAWEALLSIPAGELPESDWTAGLTSGDRRVRAAAVMLAQRWQLRSFPGDSASAKLSRLRLWLPDPANEAALGRHFAELHELFRASRDVAERMEVLELMQIGLGDISVTGNWKEWCDVGYSGAHASRVPAALRHEIAMTLVTGYPRGHPEIDGEIARLLGMLQVPDAVILDALAAQAGSESSPVDDLHHLLAAAQLPGERSLNARNQTARTLVSLHGKMEARQWHQSRFWPLRVGETFQRLTRFDPGIASAVAEDPAFGRADHSLFAALMEGSARTTAARRLLHTARTTGTWTPELIALVVASLPAAEVLPALREKQSDPALRDPIALAAARHADSADRALLLDALASVQGSVVEKVADALQRIPPGGPREIVPILRALARHEKDPLPARALHNLLAAWTRHALASGSESFGGWLAWFAATHPAEAVALKDETARDPSAVLAKLTEVSWGLGQPGRGRTLYEERGCAACHEGARLGPDLAGIATRFNREDLFAHIVNPNLAVAPPYRPIQVTTRQGAVHVGLPIYDSPEATLLEVAPGTTIRLTGGEILHSEPAGRSPMPEGLLNGFSRADLADFYAYLRGL